MKKASKKTILKDVRCSYVYLENANKDGKYSVQGLLQKGSTQYKQAFSAMKEVFIQAFGEQEWARKGYYNLALRDGDADPHAGGEPREGEEYRNHVFFNASNKRKPGIRNRKNQEPSESEMEELCFSGAYFHLSVTFASYPAIDGGKPGIGCYVNNVMLRQAGERLDGSVSAASEFEEFAEEGEETDDFDDDL